MNTDSKLRRFVILLNKAPFILFLEKSDCTSVRSSVKDNIASSIEIYKHSDLRSIIALTYTLPDPLAHNIIEALADALPNLSIYFPVHFFTKSDWQNYIEWQNVDTKQANNVRERVKELVKYDNFWNIGKPAPTIHEFTITVDRITHELNTIYSKDLESSTKAYDGIVALSSVGINVPFPKALLKECVADIYEIIKVMSMNREPGTIAKSRYMSVVQTGHETFNWCDLKKIEKDLIAVIKSNNITIEE